MRKPNPMDALRKQFAHLKQVQLKQERDQQYSRTRSILAGQKLAVKLTPSR